MYTIKNYKNCSILSSVCKINVLYLLFLAYFSFVLGSKIALSNVEASALFPIFFNLSIIVSLLYLFINIPIVELFSENEQELLIEKNKNKELNEKINELKNEILNLNAIIIKNKEETNKLKNEFLISKKNEQNLLNKIEELKNTIETLKNEIDSLNKEKEELKKNYTSLFYLNEILKENIKNTEFKLLNLLVVNNNHLNNKFKKMLKNYLTQIKNYLNN